MRSLARKAHEDGEPVRLERLGLVEIEPLADELKGLLQSLWGEGEPEVLQGSLQLSPGVAIGQHGDQQLLVVFVHPLPTWRKDRGTEGLGVADPGDLEVEAAEGEAEGPGVEAVGLLAFIFMVLQEASPLPFHELVKESFQEEEEGRALPFLHSGIDLIDQPIEPVEGLFWLYLGFLLLSRHDDHLLVSFYPVLPSLAPLHNFLAYPRIGWERTLWRR